MNGTASSIIAPRMPDYVRLLMTRWDRPVVREVTSGDLIDCDDFTVRARAVLHAQPFLECFGYRLEAPGGSFVYSGDAGPCKAMEELAQDCDVLVHMCHFISGTALSPAMDKHNMGHLELARLGDAARVRNLVVSHVSEQMDVPGVRERLIREMSAIYTGNLFFGGPDGNPGGHARSRQTRMTRRKHNENEFART